VTPDRCRLRSASSFTSSPVTPTGSRICARALGATAAAIDGMLRIDDPFVVNRRVTTASVRIGDHGLGAGTRIDLNGTSANRDEAVFGNPDACRPVQHAPHNLGCGVGIHACPGRPLATMELVVAVQALLQASPIRSAAGAACRCGCARHDAGVAAGRTAACSAGAARLFDDDQMTATAQGFMPMVRAGSSPTIPQPLTV